MLKLKLWLDDERNPQEPFIQKEFGSHGDEIWVKTANEAIELLKQGNVESISLDHDLGHPINGTGQDVANFIEEQAFSDKIPKLSWRIHSMNIVGKENMEKSLKKADKFWKYQ